MSLVKGLPVRAKEAWIKGNSSARLSAYLKVLQLLASFIVLCFVSDFDNCAIKVLVGVSLDLRFVRGG